MLLVLGLLFIGLPIAELYVIIQVSHVIGGWETLALLVVESLFGAWLMKWQGIGVLNRISQALDEGRAPGKELVDGFLILLAGALMLTPGFITDVFGYLLLLPPTRALVRRLLVARFKQGRYGRVFTVVSGPGRARAARYVGTFRAGDVQDVAGHEATNHPDDPQLRP